MSSIPSSSKSSQLSVTFENERPATVSRCSSMASKALSFNSDLFMNGTGYNKNDLRSLSRQFKIQVQYTVCVQIINVDLRYLLEGNHISRINLYHSWHYWIIRETSSGLNFHIKAFSIHNNASTCCMLTTLACRYVHYVHTLLLHSTVLRTQNHKPEYGYILYIFDISPLMEGIEISWGVGVL